MLCFGCPEIDDDSLADDDTAAADDDQADDDTTADDDSAGDDDTGADDDTTGGDDDDESVEVLLETIADVKFVSEVLQSGVGGNGTVRAIGDMDADGYEDIAIGSQGESSSALGAGAVYIVHGPVPSGTYNLAAADAKLLGDPWELGHAGRLVAPAGDVNQDGYADILVGATGDSDAGTSAGAVYLVHGPVSGSAFLADLGAKLLGEHESDQAGYGVGGGGDIDGDGVADIVVGAGGEDTGGDDAGAAYVLYGNLSGPVSLADADAKLTGEHPNANTGWSVAVVPDLNADGRDDVVVGAPGYGNYPIHGEWDYGAVYVMYGAFYGESSLATAHARLTGVAPNSSAGRWVSSAGDVNGDGYNDLLIGAYRDDQVALNAGAVYLWNGPIWGEHSLSQADATLLGEYEQTNVGWMVDSAGDVDLDGYDDLLVGCLWRHELVERNGAAYLVRGPRNGVQSLDTADLMFVGDLEATPYGDGAGECISSGDFDADGEIDFLVGASMRLENAGATEGVAYLLYGPLL